jgi:hypothetical protein
VIAFSRILDADEVLVIGNTSEQDLFQGEAIVDADLNQADGSFGVLFSNSTNPVPPGPLRTAAAGSVAIHEPNGSVNPGPARVLPVTVRPQEVQILRR